MPRGKGKPSSDPEEPHWIAQAQEGDKEAYRKLVQHYQDRLFGLVLSMVHSREQAEDLTQEIFIKVYFALSQFEGGSTFIHGFSGSAQTIAWTICVNDSFLKSRWTVP